MVKNLKNHLFQLFLLYQAKLDLSELYNHHIITLQYLTLHHMQIHIHLCSMFDRTQILGSHNIKTRKQDLICSRKKAYPRTQSNSENQYLQEKITLKVFLLNQNSFYESSLFPLGNPFDPIQPMFPHQVCLCTFDQIQPMFPHQVCLCIFDQIQPTSQHQVIIFPFFLKVITHVSTLGYPFSILLKS